jgi:hypothetical protein
MFTRFFSFLSDVIETFPHNIELCIYLPLIYFAYIIGFSKGLKKNKKLMD